MNNSIRTDSISSVLRSNLNKSQCDLSKVLQRMSTGIKVLSAKDDACGAVISSKVRVDLNGLKIANNNLQSGIAMFNVAEDALKEAEKILVKLRDLSLKAANSMCSSDERIAIQQEINTLTEELEKIQQGTMFNELNLFNNVKQKKPNSNQNNSNESNNRQENVVAPIENTAASPAVNSLSLSSNQPKNINLSPPLNYSPILNIDTGSDDNNDYAINNDDYIINNDDSPDDDITLSDSVISTPNLLNSGKKLMSSGGLRTLGAEDTGRIADNEVNDGVYITGAFDFEKNEEYKINIDGVTYTVKNRNATNATLSYSKEIESQTITFTCNSFTITGQKDANHSIIANGKSNYIYGGDLVNEFHPFSNTCTGNYFYGGEGDDVFNITGYNNRYYGKEGNDTFNIDTIVSSTYNYCYGGAGNDTFNHNLNGYEYYYGEAGEDTININGNNAQAYGGDGNDTISLNKGNSCYIYGQNGDDDITIKSGSSNFVDGGAGTNTLVNSGTNTTSANVIGANSYTIDFAKNEQKDIVINVAGQDITYTVKNRTSAQQLLIQIKEDNRVDFLTGNFTITGQSDIAHYVGLMRSSIYFYGGDLGDNVYLGSSSQIVDTGKGNDTITNVSSNNSIYTGDDNDKIYINSYGNIDAGAGNDEVIFLGGYSYNYIDLGSGNDTIRGENSNGKTNNARAYTANAIYGGGGEDSFQLTSSSKNYVLDGFDTTKFSSFEIGANETKDLVIHTNSGDMTYSIKNRIAHEKTIRYYYDNVEDKVIFAGHQLEIRGETDKAHNVDICGSYILFYGGNENDNVNIIGGYNNNLHGQGGNDILTSSSYAPNTVFYGEDGEDKIYVNGSSNSVYGGKDNDTVYVNGTSCNTCDGQEGDDSYYITRTTSSIDNYGNNVYYVGSDGIALSAGAGNDTFYITGSNNNVAGGGGDDYFIVSGTGNNIDGGTGTNYIVDNGEGNIKPNTDVDPNAGALVFTYINEQQSFSIDGKMYMVKNSTETADGVANNNVSYTYNANTGEIIFTGSNLTITACDNISHTIRIEGDNNTIQGGNLSDTIVVNKGTNNLVKGNSGNDNITLNTENNGADAGAGNDTVTINGSTTKSISTGTGNDTLNINADNNTNISLGAGNDIVRSTSGTCGNTIDLSSGNNNILLNGNNNAITAAQGDNRISVVGDNNNITSGSGNNIIGANGNSNTLEARGNSSFIVTGNENKFILSGNNNTVNSIGANCEVTSIGNSKISMVGNESSVNSIGNCTINVTGNKSSVTSIGNSDITTEGLNITLNSIGKSTIKQTGSNANIEAGTGSIKLEGSDSTLNAKGVSLNILGDNNEITNNSEKEEGIFIEIEGNSNNLVSTNTRDDVKLKGNDNTLSLNNLSDKVEMEGDNNTIIETDGNNVIKLRGSNNNIQGGQGPDALRISSGTNNTFEGGETTQKNTIYNLGEDTEFNNCIDVTPVPLHVSIQVGSGATDEITETLQFMLGDFYVDVSSIETSREGIARIDELLDEVMKQQSLIGVSINRFESLIQLNCNKIENMNIKKSLISDADIAQESLNYTMDNIRKDMQISLLTQTGDLRRNYIFGLLKGVAA